jgi:trehalose 6-phosphate phosphatase
MRLLFDEAGRQRLDEIVQPGMLCVFDFDGTLSPIVPQPDSAALPPEVRERLLTLATLAPVAILTGRSLTDIGKRLGFEPHYVIGNHGLEGMPGWEGRSKSYATACAAWRSALERAFCDKQRFDPGIRLEDKKYSLSVHYRMARNQAQAEQRLAALFETLSPPPRVVAGKCVYSLMPVDAAHKGGALEELMQQAEATTAIYVGDDVTDEDVFRLRRPDVLTVRIEPHPDTAAEFYLPAMPDIVQLLDELVRRLARQSQAISNRTPA